MGKDFYIRTLTTMTSAPYAVYAAWPATTLFPRGTPDSLYDALFVQEVEGVRYYVGLSTDNNFPDSKVNGANMGLSGADRTQVGPMFALWTLLSGLTYFTHRRLYIG